MTLELLLLRIFLCLEKKKNTREKTRNSCFINSILQKVTLEREESRNCLGAYSESPNGNLQVTPQYTRLVNCVGFF